MKERSNEDDINSSFMESYFELFDTDFETV